VVTRVKNIKTAKNSSAAEKEGKGETSAVPTFRVKGKKPKREIKREDNVDGTKKRQKKPNWVFRSTQGIEQCLALAEGKGTKTDWEGTRSRNEGRKTHK